MGTTKRPAGYAVVLVAASLILAGCGAEDGVSTTAPSPVTAPTTLTTATTAPTTTTQSETTTTTSAPTTTTSSATSTTTSSTTTSTTVATETTVEDVVTWMEAWLADQYERSDPPEGVTGPSLIDCDDSGPIRIGGVLACRVEPQTETGFELDAGGVAIYVLDSSGRAVWETGTDVPDTTHRLEDVYALATKGLMCRDLMAEEYAGETYPFSGVGRPEESAFFWSLVYWSLEGEPDRMDADRNGIPCETLHPTDMVAAVLEGGPVPLYLR